MNCEHISELIPGYALGALDVEEQVLVETHLATCPDCQAELEALRPVVASLAFAAQERQPSAELRDKVLSHLAIDSGEVEESPKDEDEERRLIPFSGWMLAAAAVVVGLVIWNVALQVQLRNLNRRLTRQVEVVALLALEEDAGVALQGTEVAPTASGRLIPHPGRQGATLAVQDMPAPPPGRVYQLWLIRPDGRRDSGGLFDVEAGEAVVYVHPPASFSEYVAVGVTDEPAGGSPEPTGTKVLGGEL